MADRQAQHGDQAAEGLLRRCAEPLPDPDDADAFGVAFDRFADARVLLLGEATHGTSEFYRARAAITRRLIERHGFTIVAVEADWPDAARIDRHVRHRGKAPSATQAFARFPTWMWRNRDVADFVDWLHAHNEALPVPARAGFRGLDVYSLGASIQAVLRYLDEVDPEGARAARERYGCLTPWQADPVRYGRAVLRGERDDCREQAVVQLRDLLGRRLAAMAEEDEAFLDAVQNARIVSAAEQYYRAMYHGSTESWNLRDRHMFDTLGALLHARGEGAKAVVWAHNSHVGNAAATEMGWDGQRNIGDHCREAFGADCVQIGFGTDRGTVAAATDWDGPMEIKQVRPVRADSHEALFRAAAPPRSLTDWRGDQHAALREALSPTRLERAIGVIYRPETERHSHYFHAVLPEQFDAFVWFEETRAVTPLPAAPRPGVADTWPFGL